MGRLVAGVFRSRSSLIGVKEGTVKDGAEVSKERPAKNAVRPSRYLSEGLGSQAAPANPG